MINFFRKKYPKATLAFLLACLSLYLFYYFFERASRVGMPHLSINIADSKSRGVFMFKYKIIKSSSLFNSTPEPIIWVEQEYRVTSFDFKRIENIKGFYSIIIDSCDNVYNKVEDKLFYISISGVNLQAVDYKRLTVSLHNENLDHDTLVLRITKTNPRHRPYTVLDSLVLYRIRD